MYIVSTSVHVYKMFYFADFRENPKPCKIYILQKLVDGSILVQFQT